MKKNEVIKEICSWIFSILLAFCIAVFTSSEVFASVRVQQSSMENTLFEDQRLIIDKLSYNFLKPGRGDIIVFIADGEKGTVLDNALMVVKNIAAKFSGRGVYSSGLIKRVIGTAGDEIDIRDGYVYVNGEKLDEPYIKGDTTSRELKFPVKVGENKLFVLGDNRLVSIDSRTFGLIDCSQVEGRAVFRIYPFDLIGKVK